MSIRSFRGTRYCEVRCSVCEKLLETRGEKPARLRLPWIDSDARHFCSKCRPDFFVHEEDGMTLVIDNRRLANADFGTRKGS